MSILALILTSFIGVTAFLFFFWRRLKEDYSSDLIFSSGLTFLVAILIGSLIFSFASTRLVESAIVHPKELWFWGAFLGLIIGLKISTSKFKVKTVETFEAALLGGSVWLLAIYISNLVARPGLLALVPIFIIITLTSLFYFLERRYRGFSWYKSGRVGFSGLAVAGIFFTLRIIFALAAPAAMPLVGKAEIILSGIVAFLLFFSLYNLSEA